MIKVSIITINYNNLEGLKRTVKSVVNQTYKNFEYILIDGGSIDGSADYIQSKSEYFYFWESERDKGIYHAMNKGIRNSTGKYLLFLNSGDELYDANVIAKVVAGLYESWDIYYGNEMSPLNVEFRPPVKLEPSFLFNSSLRHQAMFIRRDLFNRVFYYNENLKIVSDWEFYLCAILKYNATYKHLDFLISKYEGNGISQDKRNRSLRSDERMLCLKKHFKPFLEEYEELKTLRYISKLNRYKMLIKLEDSSLAKRINTVYLKLMNLFFK